jgi:hypothetical protein
MWYFGYVTPKMFVSRVNRISKTKLEAKRKVQANTDNVDLIALPVGRIGINKSNGNARLVVPIQGDSRFVIELTVKNIDGDGLLIDMHFAEVTMVPKTTYTQVTREPGVVGLYSVGLGTYERKRLRAISLKLANMLFEHIDAIDGMQVPDFLQHTFVDESNPSP